MIEIYTDGSSDNMANKKLTNNKVSGYGTCLINHESKTIDCLYGQNISSHETNNTGELSGFLLGAMLIKKLGLDAIIYADSEYAMDIWNRASGVTLRKLANKHYIRLMINVKKQTGPLVKYEWIKGHSKNMGNELADYLAGNARLGIDISSSDVTSHLQKQGFRDATYQINTKQMPNNYFYNGGDNPDGVTSDLI